MPAPVLESLRIDIGGPRFSACSPFPSLPRYHCGPPTLPGPLACATRVPQIKRTVGSSYAPALPATAGICAGWASRLKCIAAPWQQSPPTAPCAQHSTPLHPQRRPPLCGVRTNRREDTRDAAIALGHQQQVFVENQRPRGLWPPEDCHHELGADHGCALLGLAGTHVEAAPLRRARGQGLHLALKRKVVMRPPPSGHYHLAAQEQSGIGHVGMGASPPCS